MKRSKYSTISFLMILAGSIACAQGSDISIGKVHRIHSGVLQEEREYRVLLPTSYETNEKAYPVIYVLDGESYFLSAYSATTVLSEMGLMPESIVVAISNPDRRSDMSPPEMKIRGVENPEGDLFLNFLSDELLPLIDSNFRTLPLRILIGHSHGGIFNLYALKEKPQLFKWHIALDPPVHLDNNYLQKSTESFLEKNREYNGRLIVGWNRYAWNPQGWSDLEAKTGQAFKAWEIDLAGETHSSMYHTGMYKGLRQLFYDHAYQHKEILKYEELEVRYKAINADYGFHIPIPIWALRYGAMEHLAAGNPEEAESFLETLKSNYGTTQLLGEDGDAWLAELKSNPPTTTRARYLSQKEPQPDEVAHFVGAWSNEKFTIEISIEDGRLVGMVDQTMPGGEMLRNPVSKFILSKDGSLELSYDNRMAPRSALIVFRLTPVTDAVEVEKDFLVYWPRMQKNIKTERFTLNRLESK